MNKPKVLFISPQPYFEWRGSPIRVKANMTALSALGYEIDLLTLPIGENHKTNNVNIHRVWNIFNAKNISIGPSPLKLWFDILLIFKGIALISQKKYQILHGTEEAGFICYLLSRFNRAKYIFEKHSDSFSYTPKGFFKHILKIYRAVEKLTIIKSDAVISTGPALDEQAKVTANMQANQNEYKKFFVVPDTPSSIIESSDEDIQSIRESLIESKEEIIVGYAGSFASYQGIDIIFDAIPSIVKANSLIKFAIVGGSTEEIKLYQEKLRLEGVADKVNFLGKIHPDELPAYLAATDILLAPRKSGVNSPLKILDYFKAGAAIVATNTSANKRLLNEENSVLCEFNSEAFAKSILNLASSPELREKLGKNAHELYQSTYNFSEFSKQLENIYNNLSN